MSARKQRIGIFGGSFDPPHLGHFICARIAAEKLQLDQVLVIPTATQPHKPEGHFASAESRWEMIRAICADDPMFHPDRCELDRGGLSFTIDTVRELTERFPARDRQLFLIVGFDALPDLDSWKDAGEIARLTRLAVIGRTGFELSAVPRRWKDRIDFIETPRIEISSTRIRERINSELPISNLVGDGVARIIMAKKLYKA